jgi:hypothetical protein
MHEDVDDEEEDVILDRRTLIHQTNDATSNSGPILLGVNRFDIKVYENPVKLSQTKAILLATTCVSIVCRISYFFIQIQIYLFLNEGYVYGNIGTDLSFYCTTYASGSISNYMVDCFESDWISNRNIFECLSLFLVIFPLFFAKNRS